MHLFELFDEDLLRYSALSLALLGLFKNNFLMASFFSQTPIATVDWQSLINIDYDIGRTQNLIGALSQISKGVLFMGSLVAFVANLFDGDSFLPHTDVVPFFWNLTMFTLFFFGTVTGLMQKYGLQTILNDWTPEAARSGIFKYVLINFVPDFFIGVVPLYMTFLRLD